MMPEGTDTLFLAFTSTTGQSVARCTHRIFLFGYFCQREDTPGHFIGLISESRPKRSRDRKKQQKTKNKSEDF